MKRISATLAEKLYKNYWSMADGDKVVVKVGWWRTKVLIKKTVKDFESIVYHKAHYLLKNKNEWLEYEYYDDFYSYKYKNSPSKQTKDKTENFIEVSENTYVSKDDISEIKYTQETREVERSYIHYYLE